MILMPTRISFGLFHFQYSCNLERSTKYPPSISSTVLHVTAVVQCLRHGKIIKIPNQKLEGLKDDWDTSP